MAFRTGDNSETSTAQKLFEMVCRTTHPLDGKCITASSLEDGGEDITFEVPIETHIPQYEWKTTGGLNADLYIVRRSNDLIACCAIQCHPDSDSCIDNQNYCLVVFQFTVKKSHPVKVRGLNSIALSFTEDVRNKITRKVLLFVIPQCGELNEKQMLINQECQEETDLPLAVQGFEQYVFRHTI